MSTIGERIHDRRVQLGLSVDKLAEMLGKNRATVYRYESAEIENFHISVIEPLAKALQTTPAYLMGWTSESDPWTTRMHESIHNILNVSSRDDIIASGIDYAHLVDIADGKVSLSLSEACSIADHLGYSLDEMVGLHEKKLAIENDSELQEVMKVFSSLSADNRSKLLELSRLYLDAQLRAE